MPGPDALSSFTILDSYSYLLLLLPYYCKCCCCLFIQLLVLCCSFAPASNRSNRMISSCNRRWVIRCRAFGGDCGGSGGGGGGGGSSSGITSCLGASGSAINLDTEREGLMNPTTTQAICFDVRLGFKPGTPSP